LDSLKLKFDSKELKARWTPKGAYYYERQFTKGDTNWKTVKAFI